MNRTAIAATLALGLSLQAGKGLGGDQNAYVEALWLVSGKSFSSKECEVGPGGLEPPTGPL
jgi:hypothetical protein